LFVDTENILKLCKVKTVKENRNRASCSRVGLKAIILVYRVVLLSAVLNRLLLVEQFRTQLMQ